LVMRRALTYARDFGATILHETQDRDLASSGVMNEGLFASWLGLPGIPREAELIPLQRDLMLARLTRGNYHAAKISTALSAAAIAAAKAEGVNATAGISVNHLSLNENDVGQYRTFYRLSPPLRHEDDRQAMIEAVKTGVIDIVVSSHDPQDVDTKRLPFADAATGAIGLETLLGAMLRLYHNGDLPLVRIIEVLSTAPARLFGLDGGTLQPGRPADLALVDLDEPWVVRESDIRSLSKNTCFEGARLQGRVLQTLVAGRTVFSAES
ncbi:MAG: amidohydrolase family protein, partial [Notoacmeibacter sp.]|nr:amidohydrolase family protein [Notoacmeibacter sp.]